MKPLTPAQRRTLGCVADTLFAPVPGPTEFWTKGATELGIMPRMERYLEGLPPLQRKALLRGLDMLSNPAGGMLLYGRPRAFSSLATAQREAALQHMGASGLKPARQLFATLRQLTIAILATSGVSGAPSPLWEAMGFPKPPALSSVGSAESEESAESTTASSKSGASAGATAATDGSDAAAASASMSTSTPTPTPGRPIRLTDLFQSSGSTMARLTCDVVVVGSGAGGGVAAAVLAAAGHDVVVLDRGAYYTPTDFTWRAAPDDHSPLINIAGTADQGVQLYQGRAVGGGTVINYTTSLALPEAVRQDWDVETGFGGHFSGPGFGESLETVLRRYGVNRDNSSPGPRDVVLERGLRSLGWDTQTIPRNVVACSGDCGFCGFGCRRRAKQSTTRSWLVDAQRDGAQIIAEATVGRVVMRGDEAVGVDAKVACPRGGADLALRVNARAVVVAAGAIESPALLLNSGIQRRAIGRYLRLHPVSLVFGRFGSELVDPWRGTLQARLSEEFADLDGAGYGVRFETAPLHPFVFGAFAPWFGQHRFKRMLADYRHWSLVAVLLRERDFGRVGLASDGSALASYAMSGRDRRHARAGVLRAAELLAAAGADEVVTSTYRPVSWSPRRDASIQGFMRGLDRAGCGPTRAPLLSFHQMGSLRMGSDPTTSATGRDGAVHGTRGLYVMDASLFPSASGVNPMITISTLAHQAAQELAKTLAK